jgi:peptidase E
MASKQIVAMGSGGFSTEPDNPLLDRYVIHQVASEWPRVCFLATASGDADTYLLNFYTAFTNLGAIPSHFSVFRPSTADIRDFLFRNDVIYVGGGNTRSMLALWKEWGLDAILREAYEAGILLAGISAGANCWFESSVTDSVPGTLGPLAGLGLLEGSFCPHYDSERERRSAFHRLVREEQLPAGYAADDGAALHFVNGSLHAVLSSRRDARAYAVAREDSAVTEETLPAQHL